MSYVEDHLLPGETVTKDVLRDRLMQWLDDLPAEEGLVLEIGRMLPPGPDE